MSKQKQTESLSGKYQRNATGEEGRRTASFDFPPLNKDRAFDVLDLLRPMAVEKGTTVAQLALAWLLHQSAVTSVIIGANKVEQLDDNLKAVDVKFTPDELEKLNNASRHPAEYPAWMLERTGMDRQL